MLDPATMTLEDHRRAFTTFSATLIADFDRYLAREKADPAADGVVYRQVAVWLTVEESAALVKEITSAFAARAATTPGGELTRRYFSLIVMPDESSPGTLRSRLAPGPVAERPAARGAATGGPPARPGRPRPRAGRDRGHRAWSSRGWRAS